MSRSNSITNLIVIALGIFVAYHSYAVLKLGILISPGAGFLPFLCGIALIVLGVVWRLQGLLRKSRPAWMRRPAGGRVRNRGGPAAGGAQKTGSGFRDHGCLRRACSSGSASCCPRWCSCSAGR